MPMLPTTAGRGRSGGLAISQLGDWAAVVALVLFSVFLYTSIAIWFPALAILRPALVASAVAAGGALLYLWAGSVPARFDGVRGALLLFLVAWGFASVRWSLAPKVSLDAAGEAAKEALIYVVMLQVIRTPGRLRAVAGSAALASLVPSVGTLRNYALGLDLLDGTRARWLGVFQDPNHLAMALVSAIPLALLFTLEGPGLWRRLAFGASAALGVAAVVVTQSRGGAVGLGAAVLAFALTRQRAGRGLVAALLVAGGLVVFAPQAFWSRTGTIADYQTDVSAQGRVHAWKVLYALSLDRPFRGAGAGAFLQAWSRYAPIEAGQHAFVTHNVFLQPLAELGLFGFIAFLLLLASCLAATLAGRRAPRVGPTSAALFAALLGNLVCQLSSGYSPNTFLFFLLGLAASADGIARAELSPPVTSLTTPRSALPWHRALHLSP
ncbi:MAG: O-antigen ligase family protein [Deltaproteobacteria bacterium]